MNKTNLGVKISRSKKNENAILINPFNIDYNTLDIHINANAELLLNACICVVFEKSQEYSKTVLDNLIIFRNFFKKTYILVVWATPLNNLFYELKKIPHCMVIQIDPTSGVLYRNTYTSFVLKNKHIFNIMVLIDPNIILKYKPSIELLKRFKNDKIDSWDVLFANQSYKYYDIESLISNFCNIQDVTSETNKREFIKKHQTHIPRDSGLIEVKSAYGGLAFYKTYLLDGSTTYSDNTHISFNISLSKKTKKMFIDSDMVVETCEDNAFLYI